MKKLVVGLVAASLLVCVVGCKRSSKNADTSKPVTPIAEELKMPMNAKVESDIYIDSTYSMGGYVNFSHNTIFMESVKQIETTVASTWKDSEIRYIKFGDKNVELKREQFLNFANPNFYKDVDTSLDKVINSTKDGKLNIIVTDLFQTNQDIESLQLALKNKCFNDPKKAVAIIGRKGHFNGKIYDIGRNLATISYNTGDITEKYRPFYLLVCGDEIDVRPFVDRYRTNVKDCRIAFFSKNIGNPSILTSDGNIRKSTDKGVTPMADLGKSADGWPCFRVRSDADKSRCYVTLTSSNLINNVPEVFDASYMRVETQNRASSGVGIVAKIKGFIMSILGKPSNSSSVEYKSLDGIDALRFVEVSGVKFEVADKKIKKSLQITVDPVAINKKTGKYRVNMNLTAERESYKKSNCVFDEWNFEDNQTLNDKLLKDIGCKTQNVNRFTNMLSDMNYEINKPGFNDLNIYFDVK